MKHLINILFLLSLTTLPANAAILTAKNLHEACQELDKASLGKEYDADKAEQCIGYMSGFFDSLIITDQYAKRGLICVPKHTAKSRNTAILEAWVSANPDITEKTTAAVALFAAFKKAFPCE